MAVAVVFCQTYSEVHTINFVVVDALREWCWYGNFWLVKGLYIFFIIIICRTVKNKSFSTCFPDYFSRNSHDLGGCLLTLLLILSLGLLDLFIVDLCDMLISLVIDFGIGSASVVAFFIVVVFCPFVLIKIGVLVFVVGRNVTFYSTDFTS